MSSLRRLVDRIVGPSIFAARRSGIDSSARIGAHVGIGIDTLIDGACEIGAYSYVGMRCNITATRIGRYCSVANGVQIGQGEHSTNRVSTSHHFMGSPYETLTSSCCELGADVWVGAECVILRGVSIGTGSIIAANSVVTRSVPPYTIVGGVPARTIRVRFSETVVDLLLASQWWQCDLPQARKTVAELEDQIDTMSSAEPGHST